MYDNYFNDAHPLKPYTRSVPADLRSSAPATNAARGKTPTIKKGFWPCRHGKKWVQVEDHRGKAGYIDREPATITELGPLPAGWSDTPPEPTPEEKAAAERARLIVRLAEIDAASVRPLRAKLAGTATEVDERSLVVLDAEAAQIRVELGTLG